MAGFLAGIMSSLRPTKKVNPSEALGTGGTAIWGGYVQSLETNAKLTGREKYKTYSEILTNVSIVAAGTRYFLGLVERSTWKFEPAEGDNGDVADFVEACLMGMTTPWPRVVRRAALYRFHGFSVQEWTATRTDEGEVGYLDVESRPQITIEQWDVDESGTVQGILQRSPQTQELIYLPRSKCVYVVDDSLSDSPEGLGLFRHVVEASHRLMRYEQLEGFSFETDLRGIPVGRVPFKALEKAVAAGNMTAAQKAALELGMTTFIQGHIRNPQLGMILESATYTSLDEASTPSGSRMWDLELLKGENGALSPVADAIQRLNREIARVLGVETLMLGDTGAGSLALSRDKSNNFATLVDGTLEELAHTFEKDLIAPLLALNGIDPKLAPKMKPDKAQFREVDQITAALESMSKAGAVLPPDDPAINEVRDMLGLTRQDPIDVADFAASQIPKAPPPGTPALPPPPEQGAVGKVFEESAVHRDQSGRFADSGSSGLASGDDSGYSAIEDRHRKLVESWEASHQAVLDQREVVTKIEEEDPATSNHAKRLNDAKKQLISTLTAFNSTNSNLRAFQTKYASSIPKDKIYPTSDKPLTLK